MADTLSNILEYECTTRRQEKEVIATARVEMWQEQEVALRL